MKIWVSSLKDVKEAFALASPAKVISLLSPGSEFPEFESLDPALHHRVEVHDILENMAERDAPSERHVQSILTYLSDWAPEEPLLVHCWAGMSRSTATAYIAACLFNPDADEQEIADGLANASPTAFPNTRIVAIADEILGRGGRMRVAAEKLRNDDSRLAKIYEIQEARPFYIPAKY